MIPTLDRVVHTTPIFLSLLVLLQHLWPGQRHSQFFAISEGAMKRCRYYGIRLQAEVTKLSTVRVLVINNVMMLIPVEQR